MSMDYDSLAAEYAQHRRIHPGVLKRLIEGGQLTFASRILDVGCGTGNYLVALEQTVGCEGWGIEPSAEMMTKAKANAASARIKEGRAECMDFPDGFFDLVLSVDVIHHVEDRPTHFQEAARVLKRGGFVCTTTDTEEIIRHREPLSTHFPETIKVELQRYPRILDLREMMTMAGFTGIREEVVEFRSTITDIQSYRDKAFSSLHLIDLEAFERGIQRLETDLRERGSVAWWSRYLILWGRKP